MDKKYKLKPGRHQFAPRSPAIHTNDNLADEDAEWYLKKYPYIASLFEVIPAEDDGLVPTNHQSVKSKQTGENTEDQESVQSEKIGVIQENNEDLFTTN